MNLQFADWFALSKVQPTPEQLAARWQGLEALRKGLTKEDAIQLVLAACGQEPLSADSWRPLQQNFKTVDDTFRFGAEHEFRVLAAAALAVEFEASSSTVGLVAALALRSAAFQGWRSVIPDLLERAENFTLRRSVDLRKTAPLPITDAPSGPVKKALETAAARAAEGTAAVVETLSVAITQLSTEDARAQKRLTSALEAIEHRYRVAEEELGILWWLFGDRSTELDKPFANCGSAYVLVSASELASLTRLMPGPIAAAHFLAKALKLAGADKKITESKAVEATPVAWREKRTQLPNAAIGVMPLATRISAAPHEQSGTEEGRSRPALEVAVQYYNEILLGRQFIESTP